MNFREGIRRIFLVLAWVIAAGTFVGFAVNTPLEPPGYEWENKIKDAANKGLNLHPSSRYSLVWEINEHGTSFVTKACEQQSPTTIVPVCQAYTEAKENMLWTQATHIAKGLGAAFAAFLFSLGLWRLLDWILAGFGQRRETEPR